MIEVALRQVLLLDGPIAALVGDRIYPSPLPQNPTLPAISYQRVSRSSGLSLDGAAWPTRVRVQMDCWAATFDGVRELSDAVFRRLHGYAGNIASEQLQIVALEIERGDTYEPDTKLWRVSMDWTVVCKEGLS